MKMTPKVSLRSAIGGHWLTFVPPYAWLLPLWFSGSILSTKNLNTWLETLVVVAINLGALTLCVLEFLLLRVTVWRRSLTKSDALTPVWVVVAGGLILGATKAAATTIGSALWLDSGMSDFWGRVLASGALGAIVMVVVPIALSQLELYRNQRQVLIHEIVRREVQAGNPSIVANRDQLDSFIKKSLATLARARQAPETLPEILDNMRLNEVRPLSHEIWLREDQKIPKFSLGNLVSISLSGSRFVPLPVVLGYLVLIGPSEVSEYGVAIGLEVLLVQAGIVWAILAIANVTPRATRKWGVFLFFLANLAMTAAISIVTTALYGPIAEFSPLQTSLATLQVLLTLTLFTNVVSLARKTHRAVEEDLLRLSPNLGITELKRAQQQASDRNLAQLLHSQVQNVLLAKAVEVKRELESSNLSAREKGAILERTLRDLEDYILGLDEAPDRPEESTFDECRQQIVRAWSPIIRITIDISNALFDPVLDRHSEALAGIINEGVSNAVRHGLAASVCILIKPSSRHIEVEIDDDGVGPRNGQPGLGSFLLSALPESSWTLGRSQRFGGAQLLVEFSP